MDWPRTPVDRVPPSAFRPPHCPRSGCPQHRLLSPRSFRCTPAGHYSRRRDARPLPRWRCLACGSRFTQAAFATSYYLKRPELLEPVAALLNAGCAHRQIARTLACAPSTVTRLAARLGRHALLFQAHALQHLETIDEAIVLDHFESFVVRQEEALGIATPVGQRTWFVYGADPAPHKRGGRRTPTQRRRLRARPVRLPTRPFVRSTDRVLDMLLAKSHRDRTLRLVTDGHPAYRRALAARPDRNRVRHRVYVNPPRGPKGSEPTPVAKVRDRQLRPVDALHGLLRHTCSHHRRESIAFARRTNAAIERIFLTIVWRNFVKKITERRPDPTTSAMELGLTASRWDWSQVLARRLFPARVAVPPAWMRVYRREWITRSIGPNTLHRCRYAF